VPTKPAKKVRQPSSAAKYIDAAQLCERYGGVSFMWIERRLESDPDFPRPTKFGRLRYFDLAELERWERRAAVKSHAA
jgi:predicted DNA-binding transcriptional regulator AlpA